MKIALIYLFCFLTIDISLFGQAPNTKWAKIFSTVYSGDTLHYNEGNSVQQTIDSGYIITGRTLTSFNSYDVYLMKTNQSGLSQWSKKFNEENGVGNSVIQTSDSGFVVVGSIVRPSDGMMDLLLFKTNNIGEVVWRKVYGTSGKNDLGYEIRETKGNGFIISGTSYSNDQNQYSIWLIKTDENGDTLWTRTYSGKHSSTEYASVQQTNDSGFVIASSLKNIYGGYRMSLIKTNTIGDTIWTKTYFKDYESYGRSVQQTTDGGYILTGHLISSTVDIFLLRINEFGDTLWTRTFDIGDDFGMSIIQTIDKGFLICGYTYSNITYDFDDMLIKTDENGTVKWTKTIGTPQYRDIANTICQTFDNGFIITGAKKSISSYTWLVKLNPEEIVSIEEPLFELKEFKIFQNYPNPFNPSTIISYQLPVASNVTLKIYDVLGNEVATLVSEYRYAGNYETEFNAGKFSSGVYYYQLRAGSFVETKKMIYLK